MDTSECPKCDQQMTRRVAEGAQDEIERLRARVEELEGTLSRAQQAADQALSEVSDWYYPCAVRPQNMNALDRALGALAEILTPERHRNLREVAGEALAAKLDAAHARSEWMKEIANAQKCHRELGELLREAAGE